MEPRIGNKFRVGRKLGSGSFGEIYLGSLLSIPPAGRSRLRPKSIVFCRIFSFFLTSSVCAGTNVQTNEEVAIKLVSLLLDVNFYVNLVSIASDVGIYCRRDAEVELNARFGGNPHDFLGFGLIPF
jgi:hypothetical protein